MHSVGSATVVLFALIAVTSASNCKPVLCAIHCPLGFELDQNECPVCSCRRSAPTCRPVICMLHCPLGFDVDQNGCQVCSCRQPARVCEPVTCMLPCPFGFDVDQRQCPMCKCRRSPSTCIEPIFGYGCGIFDHHDCPSSHECHLRSEGEGLCCLKPHLSTSTTPSTPVTTRSSTGHAFNRTRLVSTTTASATTASGTTSS